MSINIIWETPEEIELLFQEMFVEFINCLALEIKFSWEEDLEKIFHNKASFWIMVATVLSQDYFVFLPRKFTWHTIQVSADVTSLLLHQKKRQWKSEDSRKHKHYQGFSDYVYRDLDTVKDALRVRFQDTSWYDDVFSASI